MTSENSTPIVEEIFSDSEDEQIEQGSDNIGNQENGHLENETEENDKSEASDLVENDKASDEHVDEYSEEDIPEEELEERLKEAEALKSEGNKFFVSKEYLEAINKYTEGLERIPSKHNMASILICNRAACHVYLENWDAAIKDATKAIQIEPDYTKAYHRRAVANEKSGKLKEAIEDYKKLDELDPRLSWKTTISKLEEEQKVKQEKEMAEMMGQMKDLGNKFLGLFGLSVDNFKTEKDPETGSYKINFQQ